MLEDKVELGRGQRETLDCAQGEILEEMSLWEVEVQGSVQV